MKKLLFMLLVLFLPGQAWSGMLVGSGVATSFTCSDTPTDSCTSNGGSGLQVLRYPSLNVYAGAVYTPTKNFSACSASIALQSVVGTISTYTFYVSIFLLDGNGDITTTSPLCTSSGVSGGDITTGVSTPNYFTFRSTTALTTANSYAVVIHRDGAGDSSNNIKLNYSSNNLCSDFDLAYWDEDGVQKSIATDRDLDIAIYGEE